MANTRSKTKSILLPILAVVLAFVVFSLLREEDVSKRSVSNIPNEVETTTKKQLRTTPASEALEPQEDTRGSTGLISKNAPISDDVSESPDPLEAPDPNPSLPPDLEAQLNSPPPELPPDLQQQLMNPPTELPPDLKAQLNAPPPPIPQDIKDALNTPPRTVTEEQVNDPNWRP